MRVIAAICAAGLLITPALAATLEPGIYPCRTPAGTETGSSFVVGSNGRYGDAPDSLTGELSFGGGEVRFEDAGNDGKIGRVISATRVKIGKRIFCNREKPLPAIEAAAEPVVQTEAASDRPKPKLIVVKPDLRR